jgi:4-oxalocrotonate tautomerase
MPYVNVQILEGATSAQKRFVVADITRSLVTRLGKRPEHIHIVIDEVATDNWGYAGMLTTDYLAQQRAGARSRGTRAGRRPQKSRA